MKRERMSTLKFPSHVHGHSVRIPGFEAMLIVFLLNQQLYAFRYENIGLHYIQLL